MTAAKGDPRRARGRVSTDERRAATMLAQWERLDGGPALDRPIDQPERGPVPASAPSVDRKRAAVDLWVVRADLGPGVRVLVRAGDLIPYGQETHPVEAVQPGELVGQPTPTVHALGAAQGDSGPPEPPGDGPSDPGPSEV